MVYNIIAGFKMQVQGEISAAGGQTKFCSLHQWILAIKIYLINFQFKLN